MGKGDDTITVHENDTVQGGKGNDSIVATGANNVTYVFNATDGKDSVVGFQSGFDTVGGTVRIDSATDASLVHTTLEDGVLTLYGTSTDNYALQLTEATSDNFTKYQANVKLAAGSSDAQNYEFVGNTYDTKNYETTPYEHAQALTDSVQVVYGTDATNGEFIKLTSTNATKQRTAVNMSEFQPKIDSVTSYKNVSGIDATSSTTDNVLIGSGKFNTTILAGRGATSVWGGYYATNDSIVLNSDTVSGSTVYFGANNGNDTVANFQSGDSIVVYDSVLPTAVTKTPEQQNMTLSFADGGSLTLSGVSDTVDGTLKAKAYGDTPLKFEVGNNEFTAKDGMDIYYSTQEGVQFNVDDSFTGSTLWLYDYYHVPEGKDFNKAMINGKNTYVKIDASGRLNDLALSGTKNNDTIVAGAGKTTLWGGAGTDVLYGDEKGDGIATFYFLKGYGADTTIYSYNTLDKVVLAGGTTLSDIKSYDVKGGVLSAELTDGSKLTVTNFGTTGTSTITLGGTDYTYDSTTSKFTAKA
jgi:hypothetical protein